MSQQTKAFKCAPDPLFGAVTLDHALDISSDHDTADLADEEFTRFTILAAIASLPERFFQVIYCRFFLDMDTKEIAAFIERSTERVRMLEAKALRMLRSESREHLWKRTGLVDDVIDSRRRFRLREAKRAKAEFQRRMMRRPRGYQCYSEPTRAVINYPDLSSYPGLKEVNETLWLLRNVRYIRSWQTVTEVYEQETTKWNQSTCPQFIKLVVTPYHVYLACDPLSGLQVTRVLNPAVYDMWIHQRLEEYKAKQACLVASASPI